MSVIGELLPVSDDGLSELEGKIETLAVQLAVRLVCYPGQRTEAQPSHRILARLGGREVQVGNAWQKRTKTGDRRGEAFLSLTLDDPSFPQPLNVAAFKTREGEGWVVVWRRRQDRPSPAAA